MRMRGPLQALKLLLAITLLLAASLPLRASAAASPAPSLHVLLLYDSLAQSTTREGNIQTLQRLLSSFGVQVTRIAMDSYEPGTLQQYAHTIAIRNEADLPPEDQAYLRDLATYKGNYLHIGADAPSEVQKGLHLQTKVTMQDTVRLAIGGWNQSLPMAGDTPAITQASGMNYGSMTSETNGLQSPYAVTAGSYTYVPYYAQGNLSELAMAYVLRDWLGVSAQTHTYLLYKEIYPFSDLARVQQLADSLYAAGIPFIASVRPVFHNTDYPAMKRYMETLKYIQARNGSIMVNAPVVSALYTKDDHLLQEEMTAFIEALAAYGVAPLGLGADLYWSYDRQYTAEGMDFFDSVALFDGSQAIYRERTDTSQAFASSLYALPLSLLQQFGHKGKIIPALPMNTAITADFYEDQAHQDEAVEGLSDSWITFSDYKNEAHSVHTDHYMISSSHGSLTLNGSQVDLNDAVRSVDAGYAYTQQQQQSFTTLFNVQNQIFIAIIGLTLVVFGGFLIVGYRMYKRKYLK